MSVRTLAPVLAAVTAALTLLSAPARAAADPDPVREANELSAAAKSTAKYADEALAIKDGWIRTDECASDPKSGGIGYHYVNPKYIGSVDPRTPATLVYADGPEGRELVAAEWVVNDGDGTLETTDDRPYLFGMPFDGPMPGHVSGQPHHYELHVWLFKANPHGKFAPHNPSVKCPSASAH
ncbi:hypothetical protein [Streptomyces sp. NPDC048603]|uniref:hypothetical protein n=1 Tax=Streptomyces sp. NPDC048603 TaxID=3365577 RepID=UPI003720A54B